MLESLTLVLCSDVLLMYIRVNNFVFSLFNTDRFVTGVVVTVLVFEQTQSFSFHFDSSRPKGAGDGGAGRPPVQ